MNSAGQDLVYKYAKAVLDIYGAEIFQENKEKNFLNSVIQVNNAKHMLEPLKIIGFLGEASLDYVIIFLDHYKLPRCLSSLCELLIIKKNTSLFFDILKKIIILWCQQKKIQYLFVFSAFVLNDEQKQEIIAFAKEAFGVIFHVMYVVDATLIGGIRIESIDYVWEYSLRKTIRAIDALSKKGTAL